MDCSKPIIFHAYSHCPYCIRVQLVLGWSGLKHSIKTYGYSDQAVCNFHPEKKKILPVLEYSPIGEDKVKFLSESDQIIDLVQKTCNKLVPDDEMYRTQVLQWKDETRETFYELWRPILHSLGSFGWTDFATQSDVDYARAKYSTTMNYEQAISKKDEQVKFMNEALLKLESFIKNDVSKGYSNCDYLLVPDLFVLEGVHGIVFPPKVKEYADRSLTDAKVNRIKPQ